MNPLLDHLIAALNDAAELPDKPDWYDAAYDAVAKAQGDDPGAVTIITDIKEDEYGVDVIRALEEASGDDYGQGEHREAGYVPVKLSAFNGIGNLHMEIASAEVHDKTVRLCLAVNNSGFFIYIEGEPHLCITTGDLFMPILERVNEYLGVKQASDLLEAAGQVYREDQGKDQDADDDDDADREDDAQ